MGFFNALKRLLPHASHTRASEESRQRIRAAWGLDDDEINTTGKGVDHSPSPTTTVSNASVFDRTQWQKKLRKILDELPGSQPQWHDLMTDAHACGSNRTGSPAASVRNSPSSFAGQSRTR